MYILISCDKVMLGGVPNDAMLVNKKGSQFFGALRITHMFKCEIYMYRSQKKNILEDPRNGTQILFTCKKRPNNKLVRVSGAKISSKKFHNQLNVSFVHFFGRYFSPNLSFATLEPCCQQIILRFCSSKTLRLIIDMYVTINKLGLSF